MAPNHAPAKKRRGKKLDNSLFYDFGELLSRNGVFNFVVGGRGIGKTYGAKKLVIRNYLRHGDQFIYLRRYNTELATARTFFADIAHEFPDFGFRVMGNEFQLTRDPDANKPEWETFGFVVALSTAASRKSVAYPDVTFIIYDEFIIEKGAFRYLPNEPRAMMDFYSTVDRYQDRVRVLFLANSVSIMNPYFIEYGIIPDDDTKWMTRHDGFVVAHYPNSAEFSDAVKSTRFGKFISNTEYANYAIGNHFHDNNQQLIRSKTSDAEYWFSLETQDGGRLSIWRNITSDGWEFYVQEKLPTVEVVRTFNPERMAEGKILISWGDGSAQFLRSAFRRGMVYFDKPSSRNRFVGEFKQR